MADRSTMDERTPAGVPVTQGPVEKLPRSRSGREPASGDDTRFANHAFAARLPERGHGKWAPGPETDGFVPAAPELEYRIRALLEEQADIDASRIEIWVADGQVLLRGTVRTMQESRLAEEKLKVAYYETGVQNALRVQGDNDLPME